MFYGSDEFNSAIENTHGNAPKTRLKFADDEILDLVSSIRYYGGSNDSDDVSIGTTTMARVEVSAYTDKLLTNREFLLEQGIELANGVVEYMPIGYFTVQKPQGDIDEVTFTAYDRMQKFEKPYSSNLAYPTTSALILNELCQICGIELATTLDNAIEVTENLKGYTCREVLGYIASMHGYFACIDRYGKLNLRWYIDTPIEKSLKKIWHFEKSQDNFEIAKVDIAKNSETNYVSGDGITTLHNSNPLATQEITDGIFAKLGGFNYSVGEIEMLDDARLDPWDMISVEYYDGKTYNIPCMTLEHDFKAYSTTVKSVGKSESENEYRFTGPTIQYLNRMAADLLVANRVIATKVDAEYVNSVAITTENFDAKVAEIKELIVEEIDGKYANIDLANIDIANINVGKIGELFAKVGLIDRATIVEGHITGFLDAVEVNANKITAGTLVADRILLSGGEEGVLYALNNLGELTSTNVDTLDGYVLTDRTINADKLIANSITANELDVNQIFGNEAVLNKIVSQEIFSDAVSTNTVVVGASKDAKDALDLANSTNTASGTPILLTDSAEGVLTDFKAYGRSEQIQYSGKNLFNIVIEPSVTDTDISCIFAEPITISAIAQNVVVSSAVWRVTVTYADGTLEYVGDSGYSLGEFPKTFNASKSNPIVKLTYRGGTSTMTSGKYLIQVERGTTVTEYEPYVGGVASPNPDYPQTIESVADGGYFDGELLNGYYNSSTGEYVFQASGRICSKNPIPCKSGDVVKIVLENNVSNMYICYYGENGYISMLYGTENANFIEKTIPNGATYFTFWAVNSGMTVDTVGHITVTINGKYALIVKSKGKNLFDITQLLKASGWKESNGEYKGTHSALNSVFGGNTNGFNVPKFEENTQYTLSLLAYEVGGGIGQITFQYTDGTSNFVRIPSTTMTKYTLTSASGKTISKILGSYADGSGSELHIKDIQLEIGTVATDYEPYKETVTYIPLNEPLRSSLDGIVTDEVSLTEVNRRFAEVVFDGSDDEVITAYGSNYPHLFRISVRGVKETIINIICTHFLSYRKANGDYSKNMIYTLDNYILINHMDINTVGEFKAWLQANPITVQYELAEPITETIEPVDITTYNNVTYLTASDDADMEVKYYRNTPTGIQLARLEGIEQDNSRLIANWASDNDITLIDGAKIYTGSITADKIDVDDLFAEDITATGTIRGAILKSINYDEDTGVGMLLNLNNATIESRGEDFVTIFNSEGHYGGYTQTAQQGILFAPDFDTLTGQPSLSISNGQLKLNNVSYNSYGINYGNFDILNWTTEGIATPKLSTDLIYCNGEMVAKTVKADNIQTATYSLNTMGAMAVRNKQDIATINSNLFKTDDFNIILSELTWNGSGPNMKWASYNITSKIHATKILSVSILDYSSWRDTDYINVTIGQTPDKIQIISNTTSFLATTSNIVVRVHYQAVS